MGRRGRGECRRWVNGQRKLEADGNNRVFGSQEGSEKDIRNLDRESRSIA